LLYRIEEKEFETGYGQIWPNEPRGEEYYIRLAEEAGFEPVRIERTRNTFHLLLKR
jgi:uncharacterized protein YmfQ (DUF2313 family)